jgi:antirestriction protein ArdC
MYEGTNVLVLWAAQERNGWSDNRWLTYKQAEKLGGNIIRGEKATSIIHWTPKFKDVKQPDGTTEKVFVYTPPKIINVFNVEQAEGINLPPLVKGEPIPVSQAEQTLLDTYKDRPEIFYKSQDGAYYSPVTDTVHLPLREQFGAEQDLFETLVHELAHSTGHTSRVNRKDLTDNYGTHKASRGEEELIAEISVALVAARLGVEIDFGNVASYAKSWLGALKNDPQMIIKAAKQAQKAVDHMLGKQEEPAKVDEEGNPIEPVGEGVGSEGQTGDQIAEDAGLKPEPTPEANVGEEGTTGEELTAIAKTPKNVDPNVEPERVKYGSEMHTMWNDVTFDPERKSDWRIEGGSGIMFKRIMEGQEVISDEGEISKYVTDMLVKYGYGDKVFSLNIQQAEDFFNNSPQHSDVEAAISKGATDELPDGNPFKDKDLPVLLVRKRGTTKVALLHEIAHMMEANWKNPNGDDGHNAVWFATWVTLLRSEGFTSQANILENVVGKLDEGDTGVINP